MLGICSGPEAASARFSPPIVDSPCPVASSRRVYQQAFYILEVLGSQTDPKHQLSFDKCYGHAKKNSATFKLKGFSIESIAIDKHRFGQRIGYD
jgi:hypothetical protein